MGRILAIDYGLRRTGIAVTDPLKIIASPLETVSSEHLIDWLKDYTAREDVEMIIVGMPTRLDQSDTHITGSVRMVIDQLKGCFPQIGISEIDERFTSKIARQALVHGGMKKKDRRKKEHIDKVSAAIILQSHLDQARR
ncbi:MAG: Holliday junction resolvase RuvX [Cytophagales bacterium]|nr:Holliday junction resolvase RuvX [Cytophagales bacterium]